ncbi:hypothetical protein [Staphylococcus rostri]|uniref:Uncharacterized protein n=1 Tax=Staphylococcus rostri TaxID=522262 RepID=A0A2K3YU50_9STAP|nr:hypothetical protein [Staphylococcus rostri]PNZ29143.1 hypothetical protein CD122_03160 [Staphylococcus rostri]
MVSILQRYLITCMLLVTMLILAVGFLNHYPNGGQLLLVLTFSVTTFSVMLETWLARAQLSTRKVRFIQTLAFPAAIIIMGLVCLCWLPSAL